MTFGFMDVERDPLVAPSETEQVVPKPLGLCLRSLENKDMAGSTAGARAPNFGKVIIPSSRAYTRFKSLTD